MNSFSIAVVGLSPAPMMRMVGKEAGRLPDTGGAAKPANVIKYNYLNIL